MMESNVKSPMMDSNVRNEEDMRGFLSEEIGKSESREQHGQKRRPEDEGIEQN